MTSSPAEMRTTAVTKPAVKTSCHGCSCREDALVNPCLNSRKPRQTTTPTQSGYLRSHQKVPTVATPKRATISDKGRRRRRHRAATSGSTKSPNSGYANESYNLRSRMRAWMDDAETEKLPPRHRIRPRERLPATENSPRELISDLENLSTSSPLLRQGLHEGGHNQY